jgi:putative PIN family toxin of toxin-antitoxin system
VRLVLDTNTALSGLLWGGPPGRLIQAARNGAIDIVSSVTLLTELRDVLGREKFARRLSQRGFTVPRLFVDYAALATIVAPALITPTITRDPEDDAVLAAAIGARADLIVSGDAHLLDLKSFQGIAIVTAATADSRINSKG